jgi:hypothetical protein
VKGGEERRRMKQSIRVVYGGEEEREKRQELM